MSTGTGYDIDFTEANNQEVILGNIVDELAEEIKTIENVKEELFEPKTWSGPNKEQFSKDFSAYYTNIVKLYKNSVEHHEALQKMLSSYAAPEQ